MTLNALALELIRAHRENSGDADYVLAVEQWIRDALDELAIETDWRAFFLTGTLATVAAQRIYTLPIKVRDIKYLRHPDTDQEITYATKERLIDLKLDLEEQGKPDFWYYEDTLTSPPNVQYRIGFQPVPETIYNLDVNYLVIPSTLASGNTIPILDDMLMPLRFATRAYMSMDDEQPSMADRWYQRFLNTTNKLMKRENRKYASRSRLQPTDIPGSMSDRRFARLPPDHFNN